MITMVKIQTVEPTEWITGKSPKQEHHSFGILDNRKRMIGAFISTWEWDYVVKEQEVAQWQAEYLAKRQQPTPGHKYMLRCRNTRNGNAYGASGDNRIFDTPAARDKAITKYLNEAQKRFAKQFALWNGGTK